MSAIGPERTYGSALRTSAFDAVDGSSTMSGRKNWLVHQSPSALQVSARAPIPRTRFGPRWSHLQANAKEPGIRKPDRPMLGNTFSASSRHLDLATRQQTFRAHAGLQTSLSMMR